MDQLMMEVGAGTGFGAGSSSESMVQLQDILEARKALEGGYQTTAAGGGTGAPLMAQSVEDTLTVVTAQQGHSAFWRAFPKDTKRIRNLMHEWRKQTDMGADVPLFSPEGALGSELTSTFTYNYAAVKFITHKRVVTDVMMNLNGLIGGPALAIETQNAATVMSRVANNGLFWGDASVNPYAFDGIKKVCEDHSRVFDCEGGVLDTEALMDAAVAMTVPPYFGSPDQIWMAPECGLDLNKMQLTNIRYDGYRNGDITLGKKAVALLAPVPGRNGIDDEGGEIGFKRDVYLSPEYKKLLVTVAMGETSPAAPTAGVAFAAGAPGVGVTSKFKATDAGDYVYSVKAVGLKGKSAVLNSATITVAAGQAGTVTIANPGTTDVLYYELYRSEKNGTTKYLISETTKGVTTTLITDANAYRANTSWAFLFESGKECKEWKQIVDMFVKPLAQTDFRLPVGYGLFGMPIFKKFERIYALKNIGRAV